MHLICIIVNVYLIICVVRIVMSFLDVSGGGVLQTVATLSYSLTEPLFASVRRYMPQMGDLPIDFSPVVIMVGLGFLRTLVCGLG